jgi:hypothetical protein
MTVLQKLKLYSVCQTMFCVLSVEEYTNLPSNLKILGTRKVTLSKFYAEDKHASGATLQNLVTWSTWLLKHVYPHFSDNVTKDLTKPHKDLPVWNRPKNPFHHGQVLSVIMGLE